MIHERIYLCRLVLPSPEETDLLTGGGSWKSPKLLDSLVAVGYYRASRATSLWELFFIMCGMYLMEISSSKLHPKFRNIEETTKHNKYKKKSRIIYKPTQTCTSGHVFLDASARPAMPCSSPDTWRCSRVLSLRHGGQTERTAVVKTILHPGGTF